LDEIQNLKSINEELKQSLQKNNTDLKKSETELNKERLASISFKQALNQSIMMHEMEIMMRLKFESKLNNISAI